MATLCPYQRSQWTWKPPGPRNKTSGICIWDQDMNWAVFTKALIEDLNGGLVQNGAETKTNLSSCVRGTAA